MWQGKCRKEAKTLTDFKLSQRYTVKAGSVLSFDVV